MADAQRGSNSESLNNKKLQISYDTPDYLTAWDMERTVRAMHRDNLQ
jgi:hypothetical protein